MPKFVIKETFTNGTTSRLSLQTGTEAEALTLAGTLLGGQVSALIVPSTIPVTEESATVVDYIHYNCYCADSTTGSSTFVAFDAKDTVSDLDVRNMLIGKTINGVNIDTVTVKGSFVGAV